MRRAGVYRLPSILVRNCIVGSLFSGSGLIVLRNILHRATRLACSDRLDAG